MKPLDRRTFLRCGAGGLGTAVALPSLAMMFKSETAFADALGLPRFLTVYQPNGYCTEKMWPAGITGARMKIPELAACGVAPLNGHRDKITIFKDFLNSTCGNNPANPREGGSVGNDHLLGIMSFLTAAMPPNDDLLRWRISVDQFIANHYQATAPTRKASLQLSANNDIDPHNATMEYNNNFKNGLAYDKSGNILPNINDVKKVFTDLFAGTDPAVTARMATEREERRKIVLDQVHADAKALVARAGAADRMILDQYFTSIAELQRQISTMGTVPSVSCKIPLDLPTGITYPTRVDRVLDHYKVTSKLLAVAFQCEATRVVTYMLSGEAANPTLPEAVSVAWHDAASHSTGGANRMKYHAIDVALSTHFGLLLDTFAATPLGAGSLLDNTIILWGASLGDGAKHLRYDQFSVLAGNVGGKLKHGALLDMQNKTKHSALINTILNVMGVPAPEGFGDAKPTDLLNLSVAV